MSKNKFATILIILFLAVIALLTIVKYAITGNGVLVSPGIRKALNLPAAAPVSTSIPAPQAASYNPPKELKYGSSTDLKKELDSINPQVLDSDFE